MIPDAALLHRCAEENDEVAFAELVQRHLPLVYSAALRRMRGDPHGAAEVAQQVFTMLARRAAALSRRTTPSEWPLRLIPK